MTMNKIYIEIPFYNNEHLNILKNAATEYCNNVNNLLYKAKIYKNNEHYNNIIKQYITNTETFKINFSNMIIGNHIIDNIKNSKLIDENEFNKILSLTKILLTNLYTYTDYHVYKTNTIVFLFFDNKLMFNIF